MMKRAIVGLSLWMGALVLPWFSTWAEGLPNPFFAMDTGTRDATHKTPAEQVALAKEVGFPGVGPIYHSLPELQEWLTALDGSGMKLFALYVPLALDNVAPSLAAIREVCGVLRGRETLVWLYVTDKGHQPSAVDDDEVAAKALREAAAAAQAAGLRIALYPHTGFYVQKVEDAVRLVKLAGCANVGVTFNLCHWLKVDGKDLPATLEAAKPHLFCVTVNGADAGGTDWKRLIQPLGQGTYEVLPLLRWLRKANYTGPIGLQHYGIPGEAAENLKHSLEGWRKLSAAAVKEPAP